MSNSPKRQAPIQKVPQASVGQHIERPQSFVPIRKQDQQSSSAIICGKCTKIFISEQAYNIHMKNKHSAVNQQASYKANKILKQAPEVQSKVNQQSSQRQQEHSEEEEQPSASNNKNAAERAPQKKTAKKIPFKNRMAQIQQNQQQDTIYAFLGQLGQKNTEPVTNRSEFILHNENQRLTGQTNYSLNKVVRTPYEQPIKASQCIPTQQIQRHRNKQFLLLLKQQLKKLEDKVQAQRQTWQLRDPMAPQQQTQDQFSLMDIRKLIINYPKRNVNLKYPHFSIFMLWIARICKPPAFKQFFIIIGSYVARYESIPENKNKAGKSDDQIHQYWRTYLKNHQQNMVDKEVVQKLTICDDKNYRKFLDLFVQWTFLFKCITI